MHCIRIHIPAFTFLVLFVVAPSTATNLDYASLWAHLADTELDEFLYDCGGAVDVAVKGHMAYVVDNFYGLQVVDWSDPTSIVYCGYLPIGLPKRCAIRDHFLFVAVRDNRIDVIDVDDQYNPVLVNQVTLDVEPDDLLVFSSWLYVGQRNNTVRIFNLANPSLPTPVNTLALPSSGCERLVFADGRVVVAGDAGLCVLDVTIPEWPSVLGTYPLTGDTLDLASRDGLALVGQGDRTRLIDITDPSAMDQVAELPEEGEGVFLTSNGQAWVGWLDCWFYGGLRIYDVDTPTSPRWLHDVIDGFRGAPLSLAEQQGLIFAPEYMCWCAGEYPGFHIFQLGVLPLPEPLAVVDLNSGHGLVAWRSRVDVATDFGIESWDLSDPVNPVLLGSIDPGYRFHWLVEEDGLLVTCRSQYNGPYWLQVLSREPDGSLVWRGDLLLAGFAKDLGLSGSRAVVAMGDQLGAILVDLADPDAPVVAAELFAGETFYGAALHGDLAALSTYPDLKLVDLADPLSPVELASVPNGAYFTRRSLGFTARAGRLWLQASRNWSFNYDGGFADLLDVTDPVDPQLIAPLRQLGMEAVGPLTWYNDLLVVPSGRHLTLYRYSGGAEEPGLLGRVQVTEDWIPTDGRWAAVASQALATVSLDGQLQIWPLPTGVLTAAPEPDTIPDTLHLSAVPNPFNPTCEICFDLPAAGQVVVAVFDARGRLVRNLERATAQAGRRAITWNGRDDAGRAVPAGVYLARIVAGDRTAIVKVTLAK